ncbi:uncharacterized protein LOC143358826 [Halictus rubicundus]|uniref:uncharacterized protein LOC143358826 n=1 Tax=Halictus rubicundus TaxID=77578 RepID=UPI004035F81F
MRRLLQQQCMGLRSDPVMQVPAQPVPQPSLSTWSARNHMEGVSITAIADLLAYYDGDGNQFERWEKQIRLLAATYDLYEEASKLLVGRKLRGKTLEWFHSRPEFLAMTTSELMARMREMFHRRLSKTVRRRTFEDCTWKPSEPFGEYFHRKVILANMVPIEEDEMVDLIIEGIPDATLRNQAFIQRFRSPATLMEAFERVTLKTRVQNEGAAKEEAGRSYARDEPGRHYPTRREDTRRPAAQGWQQSRKPGKRCPSCGLLGHRLTDCPTRDKGVKCFECRGYGHVSANCPTKAPPRSSYSASWSGGTKYQKQALIHGLQPALILGADMLNKVNLVIENGRVTISKPERDSTASENIPEVFNIIACDTPKIDVSYIADREQRREVIKPIDEYKPREGHESEVKMRIILHDEEPVYQRAKRLSPVEKDEVNAQIRDWLAEGIVRPSLSEFASPIVLVKKKNGSKRLCVDYRALNKKIVKDRYPLPLIEDQLDKLQGARIFSTLDLKNGFFHVQVDEASREYTSFVTPYGQYEFCRVPFGLANSPAVFQRFINAVFRKLIAENIVMAYMDDLIIPSADERSGLEKFKIVLDTAARATLVINWGKCRFLQPKVEFLGHIIENGMVRPSENKTKAVRHYPNPRTVKQLQSFLGLAGYFRKFVPQYSLMARPLTKLLKAGVAFEFGEEQSDAINELKAMLSSSPVLKLYSPTAETELHTDPSKFGFGAVLLQRDREDGKLHSVYYSSGKTTDAEARYSSYELEILAVVKALKKFRIYLLGIPFKIITDCKAFALTMNKKDLCVRVPKWALLLEEFDYTIEHRTDTWTARLRKAQREDSDMEKIAELARQHKMPGYVIKSGLLFKEIEGEPLLVVPKMMQMQLIRQAHERGHFAVAKTLAIINKDYYIPNVTKKIEKVVTNCVACTFAERKRGKLEGMLHALDKGELPLDTYRIDHLGPLSSTKKSYRHSLVVIDAFSKFTWLYATKSTSAAEVVSRLRKQAVIFGNPRYRVSDRGSAFTSSEFKEYCESERIEHQLITNGIPRTNGHAERVNRVLIPVLTKMANPRRDEWYKHLETSQVCLNTMVHRTTGSTPFSILFSTYPRLREYPKIRQMLEQEWVEGFQRERDEIRATAQENIQKVQAENRKTLNKNRVEAKPYAVNDIVAMKRTQQGPGQKLATKFLGPYKIVRALRNERYVVEKIGDHEGPMVTKDYTCLNLNSVQNHLFTGVTVSHQHVLFGRISRTVDNLKKLGKANLTKGTIQSKLAHLDAAWVQFQAHDDKIVNAATADDRETDYFTLDLYDQAEGACCVQSGQLLAMLDDFEQTQALSTAVPPPTSGPRPRSALPRITLPTFSGQFTEWTRFRDLFTSLVVNDEAWTDAERFHYLSAWEVLEHRYQNRRLLVAAQFDALYSIKPCTTHNATELKVLLNTTCNVAAVLNSLGITVNDESHWIVHHTVRRLNRHTLEEWEKSLGCSVEPSAFSELLKFLETTIRTIEASEFRQGTRAPMPGTPPPSRVKALQPVPGEPHPLLLNCLGPHNATACPSAKRCQRCAQKHHTMLHEAANEPSSSQSVATLHTTKRHELTTETVSVLLATALVTAAAGNRTFTARAMIDPCSEVSLISESLVQRMRFPRTSSSQLVLGAGGKVTATTRGKVYLTLTPTTPVCSQSYRAGGHSPRRAIRAYRPGNDFRVGSVRADGETTIANPSPPHTCSTDDLTSLVRRFWEQEEVAAPTSTYRTAEEKAVEKTFRRTHYRQADERYVVRLCFKDASPSLGESHNTARRILLSTERRLRDSPAFCDAYHNFMREYLQLGHMQKVPRDAECVRTPQFYLPHHGVMKGTGACAKLRVVFNGSRPSSTGQSQNHHLSAGPKLQ